MSHLEEARIELVNASFVLNNFIQDIVAHPELESLHDSSFAVFSYNEALKDLQDAYNIYKGYKTGDIKPAAGIKGKKLNN